MKIKILLTALLLPFLVSAFGQSEAIIDSLENVVSTIEANSAKVDCLNKLSKQYRDIKNLKMSRQYAESALELATTLDYKKGIAHAKNLIGVVLRNQGKPQKALILHFEALEISQDIDWDKGIAYSQFLIGVIYSNQNNKTEALKYLLASLYANKTKLATLMFL